VHQVVFIYLVQDYIEMKGQQNIECVCVCVCCECMYLFNNKNINYTSHFRVKYDSLRRDI